MLFRRSSKRPPPSLPPTTPTSPPPTSPLQNLKAKFAAAGLEPRDLVPALVVHEALGLAMAAGFWASCYALQPSKRLSAVTNLAPPRPLAALYSRSLETARARLPLNSSSSNRAFLSRAEPARATVSLAESLVLRATIKPATFVFKIWASAAVVSGAKRVLAANRTTRGGGKREGEKER